MEYIELLLEICIKCAYHKKIKIKDKYKQKKKENKKNQSNVHNSAVTSRDEEYSQAQNTKHYKQQLCGFPQSPMVVNVIHRYRTPITFYNN
jgi:DNA-directed RNA polymerase subunit M/transcription elongation factor TFIIS